MQALATIRRCRSSSRWRITVPYLGSRVSHRNGGGTFLIFVADPRTVRLCTTHDSRLTSQPRPDVMFGTSRLRSMIWSWRAGVYRMWWQRRPTRAPHGRRSAAPAARHHPQPFACGHRALDGRRRRRRLVPAVVRPEPSGIPAHRPSSAAPRTPRLLTERRIDMRHHSTMKSSAKRRPR